MTTEAAPLPGPPARVSQSWAMELYVATTVIAGAVALAWSVHGLYVHPPDRDFLYLLALTLASSVLPIRLPNVSANISVAETFIFLGTLRYGAPVGVPLVFLDALVICLQMARRGTAWQKLVFSLSAPAVSLAAAAAVLARVTRSEPLAWIPTIQDRPPIWLFLAGVLAFTLVYFLLNTWFIAIAIAIDRHVPVFRVWRRNFSTIGRNYAAGASIAVLLVYNSPDIQWVYLAFVFPLLLAMYLTYRWTSERVQQAERHVAELTQTFLKTVEALALAIDVKDQVTHGHIRRVQRSATELARSLGVQDDNTLDAIRAAALLHDTGKLAVPEYILNKPAPLSPAEFDRMKKHATIGADILKSIHFPYPVEPIVRHHHEHWDGSGYPSGLKGQDIPVGARILAVVDCYDALTSDRPYRSHMSRAEAEEYLRRMRGSRYDPWVVDGFLAILDRLEAAEATDRHHSGEAAAAHEADRTRFQVLQTARAENRELQRLRRDLPLAASAESAVHLLLDRLQPLMPVMTLAMYVPLADSTDIYCAAAAGLGSPAISGTEVPIGERVSGWVYANGQTILNAEAILELGDAMKASPVALTYTLAVPILNVGRSVGVVALFSAEPFSAYHQRLVETAVSLLPRGFVRAIAS